MLQRFGTRCALVALGLLVNRSIWAGDILVAPGQLPSALQNAMPGDSLLLLPGVHSGGLFRAGLQDVIIRSNDPANRAIIRGGINNIQLSDARNVTIEQLVFEGGTGNGINIDDGGSFDTPSTTNITIRDITVQDVGTGGNNDGIKLSGVTGFLIDSVRVLNWGAGGSAIDPVGSHNGLIQNSLFRHTAGGPSFSGVRPKGGSKNITIRANRFELTNGNGRAIQFGGSTGSQFFRFIDGDSGHEADAMVAEGNVIVGGNSAANWVNIDGGVFHHNYIQRPSGWTMRILNENQGGPFVDTQNGTFRDNVVVFNDTPSEYSQAVNVGPETEATTFAFADNQWLNLADPSPAGSTPSLPSAEENGTYGQDPGIDPDDVIAWQFDWGLWLVNASGDANVYSLGNVDDLRLASAVDANAEFAPSEESPFVGNWSFVAFAAGDLQLAPFTQLILANATAPQADADSDGDVDGSDFLAWQRGFGGSQIQQTDGNFDGDNDVDADDLAIWEAEFGSTNQLATSRVVQPVPEASSVVLVVFVWIGYSCVGNRYRTERAKFVPFVADRAARCR